MEGRVALVTGASVGIGAGVCRALVKRGVIVVGVARNVGQIEAIAQENDIALAKGKLVPLKCDLREESDIVSVFNEIRRRFGRLDICISNAGLVSMGPLLSADTQRWKDMLDVNVMGLCICNREAAKLMREKSIDGHIINMGSTAGHDIPTAVGYPGAFFYSATKFMVRCLTEGLRRELKELNSKIRVGSISPGTVETEFLYRYKGDPDKSNGSTKNIYQALEALQPDDIAESVVYILTQPDHVEVYDIIVRPIDPTKRQ